jgi:hypothetical protein
VEALVLLVHQVKVTLGVLLRLRVVLVVVVQVRQGLMAQPVRVVLAELVRLQV